MAAEPAATESERSVVARCWSEVTRLESRELSFAAGLLLWDREREGSALFAVAGALAGDAATTGAATGSGTLTSAAGGSVLAAVACTGAATGTVIASSSGGGGGGGEGVREREELML